MKYILLISDNPGNEEPQSSRLTIEKLLLNLPTSEDSGLSGTNLPNILSSNVVLFEFPGQFVHFSLLVAAAHQHGLSLMVSIFDEKPFFSSHHKNNYASNETLDEIFGKQETAK